MNPETEKLIKEEIKKLPEEVRRVVTDSAVTDKILDIGKKNGLTTEQTGVLLLEVYLVILNLSHPDDLRIELRKRLNIDDSKLSYIENELNEKILDKIKPKLIEMFEKLSEDEENKTKEDIKNKKTNLVQDVNFIISGGDYSVFLDNANEKYRSDTQQAGRLIGTSNILETKNKLLN